VAKIGKEPVSEKQNLIDKCYDELVSMAKDIGTTLILLTSLCALMLVHF